uniref:Ribosome recycling factor domain-containing protein n=1 Tax=Favella ehrenbergii TaxID=182087 RepID=A0A7S3MJH8_9SPIT|mmetsp:Transcript_11900/g.15166  ORF Transcript_11900/g.15166 Transcript_11900/m.15166 type:complete len:170 (+) Transcript_11900:350-859(+)
MCLESLNESLASIKSGRASPTIFNDVMCRAYGEEYPLGDLATTVVQGSNSLLIKVFDESVKEEVLKGLQRCDFELSCQMEGKDIRVKLGTSRKEHIEAGLKKVKESLEALKKQARDERQSAMQLLKKLSKVLPESEAKNMEQDFNNMIKQTETSAKEVCDAKEVELKQA